MEALQAEAGLETGGEQGQRRPARDGAGQKRTDAGTWKQPAVGSKLQSLPERGGCRQKEGEEEAMGRE